jgi:hypothetical protein
MIFGKYSEPSTTQNSQQNKRVIKHVLKFGKIHATSLMMYFEQPKMATSINTTIQNPLLDFFWVADTLHSATRSSLVFIEISHLVVEL